MKKCYNLHVKTVKSSVITKHVKTNAKSNVLNVKNRAKTTVKTNVKNRRNSRRQHNNEQVQQDVQNNEQPQSVPRRDRNNQQRPNRPNRHRDQSVLNEQAIAQEVAAEQQPVKPQSTVNLKLKLVDAPRQDVMATALGSKC